MTALFGYACGTDSLYTVPDSYPVVLRTAVLTFLLVVGMLGARPAIGFMALVTGSGFAGTLLRRLLPTSLLMLFALGWLRIECERHHLYSTELGVAVFTMANIVTFTCWCGGAPGRCSGWSRIEISARNSAARQWPSTT